MSGSSSTLETDPNELRSMYGEASHTEVQAQLEAELARLRRELRVPPDR